MKICIYGLWHLGVVTAACLAEAGFTVIGLDEENVIAPLNQGIMPIYEPGLKELIQQGLHNNNLSFTHDSKTALATADLIWVTFDTPVDDHDQADMQYVNERIKAILTHIKSNAVVLISSQLPVGNTARLEQDYANLATGKKIHFAYSPENLRLGNAITAFKTPERTVIGIREAAVQQMLEPILNKFSDQLLWMSIESTEMVKHALNSFLATCVTFANEIANICETVNADASEVEKALRSEPRIGKKAYIKAGSAFAGGTLARDVQYLLNISQAQNLNLPLLQSIIPSNNKHRHWAMHQLTKHLKNLVGKTIALLGLAYKPETSSLRRSTAIELCHWLHAQGATIHAFDPQVNALPHDLCNTIRLMPNCEDALTGSDALVIATEWPEFKNLNLNTIKQRMRTPLIVDQTQFLGKMFATDTEIKYITLGKMA